MSQHITVTIDNKTYSVQRGTTILDVARQNDIYIPTLCYHQDLSPHGGCRMCIVEVEGVRNFPTACTTPIDEGMIIRTHTAQLQEMRMDILQLFLSEHTSSCLVCDEKVECRLYMSTVRKAGVTTGCRYCPKDGVCELQAVAASLNVTEINYPISYRNLRVETEDPFYDRDYNLCILCGRCVRMCQEIRVANVLAYKNRGRNTIVGPAFHRTHLEAGCEFCGACVAVCPTGSLREKTRAWEGQPDRHVVSTCSFCGVGCQVELLVKGNRLIGSLPFNDPIVNNGQLCVKGRFCNTELVNSYQRLKSPYEKFGVSRTEVSWNHALDRAAEQLKECPPDDFAMLVSPNCTTEDLYVAQKFARTVMHTHNIDTSARIFYGQGFNAYLSLMRKSVTLSDVYDASVICSIGLDTRYGRSVVGVALRKAVKRGARIISINSRHHNFSLIANPWIQPDPGGESIVIHTLVELLQTGDSTNLEKLNSVLVNQIESAAGLLKKSSRTVLLIGSEFLQYDDCADILNSIENLSHLVQAGILPLPAQNNLYGSLIAGAYPELLPGNNAVSDEHARRCLENSWNTSLPQKETGWNAWSLWTGKRMKVLYLIGDLPPNEQVPADFLLFQNIFPPEPYCTPDIILPSAGSTEVDGTFINGEGRIQYVRKATSPPGNALPDWEILCRLAKKMGVNGFEFNTAEEIREEMSLNIGMYKDSEKEIRIAHPLPGSGQILASNSPRKSKLLADDHNYLFSISVVEHSHRGYPLSAWVEGSKMLLTEGMAEINPEDAKEISVNQGDPIIVTSNGTERTWFVKIMRDQPRGTLHASLRDCAAIQPNPQHVSIRKANV
ncbi:MAG: molybdopterin-dependent oxidoreductase [bacterium]